jgi:CRISPR-associated protein Cst2
VTYLTGKIALEIRAGAPNNARGQDNIGVVKKLYIGREPYPYVSAQAFRRWVRDSVPAAEPCSPVTAEKRVKKADSGEQEKLGRKQQAYTAGRPDLYLDDDLFGYMVAVKGENFQRDTVLATGTLVAVAARRPERDFGTMTRGFPADAPPLIHEHELYSAELAGDLLLDLPRVGTFEQEGGGLRRALRADAAAEALAAGARETRFRNVPSIRLPLPERRRRAAVLLRTLAQVRGGAHKAMHYGDRTPALVLLAPLKGGNNPFTRVLTAKDHRVRFDLDTFAEELGAWADELDGPVLIGWSPGFLGEDREQARRFLAEEISAGQVVIDHPRAMLRRLADEIESGRHDPWFEDPAA